MGPFSVVTDNNTLTSILTTANLDVTCLRWLAALGQYSFDITYRPGLQKTDADGMSRYPYEKVFKDNTELVKMDEQTVKAVCNSTIIGSYIETLPMASLNIVETTDEIGQGFAQKELREIRKMQRQDELIDRWRKYKIDEHIPSKFMTKK